MRGPLFQLPNRYFLLPFQQVGEVMRRRRSKHIGRHMVVVLGENGTKRERIWESWYQTEPLWMTKAYNRPKQKEKKKKPSFKFTLPYLPWTRSKTGFASFIPRKFKRATLYSLQRMCKGLSGWQGSVLKRSTDSISVCWAAKAQNCPSRKASTEFLLEDLSVAPDSEWPIITW